MTAGAAVSHEPNGRERTITAVISDFGGVLTSPLSNSFSVLEESAGISGQALGEALWAIFERTGTNPLYELETGRITESEFVAAIEAELADRLGRTVELVEFGTAFFDHLHPNEPMIEQMRSLRRRGYRMAICTNNVREWETMWRAKLPVDEIFEVVVDSAFVGVRKPDREIYEIALDRLGIGAGTALFVDDVEINCDAARALGMTAVHFRDTDQAIAEIESALAADR